ncbi:hypothetical protein ACHAXS_003114 [Conticribra weissflogii]
MESGDTDFKWSVFPSTHPHDGSLVIHGTIIFIISTTIQNTNSIPHLFNSLQNVAFYSFSIFALGQMFVAVFVARSQAMIGDSSAMIIDSLTYLFNSYAERIKNVSLQENLDERLSGSEKEMKRLERTRQRLWLEILPPLCSVMTLIGLTIYIIVDAWTTLNEQKVEEREAEIEDTIPSSKSDAPDIGIMFFFSGLNLALDVLNVTCFARAKRAFGFAVIDQDRHRYMLAYDGSLHNQYADSMRVRSEIDLSGLDDEPSSEGVKNYSSVSLGSEGAPSLPMDEETNSFPEVNLNMCSAYTVSLLHLSRICVSFEAGIILSYLTRLPPFCTSMSLLTPCEAQRF